MKPNKTDLQKALEIVKPGLANSEIIEQSTSFVIKEGRIITYNDEISISHPVKGLEFEGVIQADRLYQLLSKIKKDEIELDVTDEELLLKTGRVKAGITLQQEIKLPLDEELSKQGRWKELPKNFVDSIRFTMGACSRDMSRPILTCVHFNTNHVESSDSFKIARYELKGEIPFKSFQIPATSVAEVVKLNPIQVAKGEGWIHFKNEEDTIISCRNLYEEFPDISHFLKVEGIEITFPKTISDILDRAAVFSKRDHFLDEVITISLKDKRIKIESRSESGWFEEEANIRYDDDPITFTITPYLLKDILQEIKTCIICEDRLKFEGENWVYVTTLTMEEE